MICTVRFEFEAENFFPVPFRESVHFTLNIRITSPDMERKPEWDPKAIEKLSERDKLVSFFIKFSYNQLYNLASHKNLTVHYTCSLTGVSQDQGGVSVFSALDWAQRLRAGLLHLPSWDTHPALTALYFVDCFIAINSWYWHFISSEALMWFLGRSRPRGF